MNINQYLKLFFKFKHPKVVYNYFNMYWILSILLVQYNLIKNTESCKFETQNSPTSLPTFYKYQNSSTSLPTFYK